MCVDQINLMAIVVTQKKPRYSCFTTPYKFKFSQLLSAIIVSLSESTFGRFPVFWTVFNDRERMIYEWTEIGRKIKIFETSWTVVLDIRF